MRRLCGRGPNSLRAAAASCSSARGAHSERHTHVARTPRRRDNPASSRFHRSAPNRCASRLIEAQRAQWSSPHLQRSAPFGSEQSRAHIPPGTCSVRCRSRRPRTGTRPRRASPVAVPSGRRAPRASLACRTSSLAAPLLRGHATAPRRAGAAHRARTAAARRRARAGRCGDVLFLASAGSWAAPGTRRAAPARR